MREIVATMPITSSSAQAPKTIRRIMSLTWIAIASESGTASASATPSAIGCWAEASARSAPLRTSVARAPVSCRNGNSGAQVVEDVVLRARLDDRAERHDGAADDDRLEAALDVPARAHAGGDEHEHDREREQVRGRLRGLGAERALRERGVVHGQRDDRGGREREQRAADAAGADAAGARDRAEQQRRSQQEHHQPVGLELDGARCRQRVDPDRDEPHDRDERDQRERPGGCLDGVDRAGERRRDGLCDRSRAGRGASSSPAPQVPAKTAAPTAIAAPPTGSVAISASRPRMGSASANARLRASPADPGRRWPVDALTGAG